MPAQLPPLPRRAGEKEQVGRQQHVLDNFSHAQRWHRALPAERTASRSSAYFHLLQRAAIQRSRHDVQAERSAQGYQHLVQRGAGACDVGHLVGIEIKEFSAGYDAPAQLAGVGTRVKKDECAPRHAGDVVVLPVLVAFAGIHGVRKLWDAGYLRGVVAPWQLQRDAAVQQVAVPVQGNKNAGGVEGVIRAEEVCVVHVSSVGTDARVMRSFSMSSSPRAVMPPMMSSPNRLNTRATSVQNMVRSAVMRAVQMYRRGGAVERTKKRPESIANAGQNITPKNLGEDREIQRQSETSPFKNSIGGVPALNASCIQSGRISSPFKAG